jgi:hypothetical protein
VASLMVDAGLVVLTAFISPHRAERQMVRERVGRTLYRSVCRYAAGDLRSARSERAVQESAGRELRNFTGIDSVYEAPEKPEIHLDGEQLVTNLVHQLLDLLRQTILSDPETASRERLPNDESRSQDSICAIVRTSVSPPGRSRGDRRRDHLVFPRAAVGFISWLLALGIPFLIYGSNTLFFFSTPGLSSWR